MLPVNIGAYWNDQSSVSKGFALLWIWPGLKATEAAELIRGRVGIQVGIQAPERKNGSSSSAWASQEIPFLR